MKHGACVLFAGLLGIGCERAVDLGQSAAADASPDIAAGSQRVPPIEGLERGYAGRRTFVTHDAYTLNRRDARTLADVFAEPDAICSQVARAASLDGDWRALVFGFFAKSARDPFDHVDWGPPYVTPDRQAVVFSAKSPGKWVPSRPFTDERSGPLPSDAIVWMGKAGFACADEAMEFPYAWSSMSSSDQGAVVRPSNLAQWSTPDALQECARPARLYCFEQ